MTTATASNAPISSALGYLRGAVARMTGAGAAEQAAPFLTISNTRAGASWLAAHLGALEDVDVDGEVKWRPAYQPQPLHVAIESAEESVSDRLRDFHRGGALVGSKLVLDPYQPFLHNELDELLTTIDPSTKVVHVTRSYFEMLKSIEARGSAPRATEEAMKAGGAPEALLQTELFQAMIREAKTPVPQKGFAIKPATALAKTLLILFINDLVCAKICAHVGAENAKRVRYENLEAELPAIAQFLGAGADDAEVRALVDRPLVDKYREIQDNFAPHFKLLLQLAKELDAVRDAVIDGTFEVDNIWRDETPPLHLPQKVGALLSMLSALDVPTNINLGQKLKAALGF